MENYRHHLLPTIRSNYLTTLIFSYYSHMDINKELILKLSSKGQSFISDNIDQITYFWLRKASPKYEI
jgi:hypothetical protein